MPFAGGALRTDGARVGFRPIERTLERENVIKIFDALIPKFDVKAGDGLGSDVDCVFARKWDQSYHRDADGEPTEAFQPHQVVTIEQALDPLGRNKNMFCDYSGSDAQAQKLAIDKNQNVSVASIGFSYPDFGPDYHTAAVYYKRSSQIFLASKRKNLPVGSIGIIKFVQHDGIWSFETVHLGTFD